jgi:hypothetical protein
MWNHDGPGILQQCVHLVTFMLQPGLADFDFPKGWNNDFTAIKSIKRLNIQGAGPLPSQKMSNVTGL